MPHVSISLVSHDSLTFAINFELPMLLTRVLRLVGVGEASFISLAAPFIDDNAPVSQVCLFKT